MAFRSAPPETCAEGLLDGVGEGELRAESDEACACAAGCLGERPALDELALLVLFQELGVEGEFKCGARLGVFEPHQPDGRPVGLAGVAGADGDQVVLAGRAAERGLVPGREEVADEEHDRPPPLQVACQRLQCDKRALLWMLSMVRAPMPRVGKLITRNKAPSSSLVAIRRR